MSRLATLEACRSGWERVSARAPDVDVGKVKPGVVQTRDLAVVDGSAGTARASVAVRAMAVLVGLPPVRAVVLPDRLLVFTQAAAAAEGSLAAETDVIVERIAARLAQLEHAHTKSMPVLASADAASTITSSTSTAAAHDDSSSSPPAPFEMRALEAVLSVACALLSEEADALSTRAIEQVRFVVKEASAIALEDLRKARNRADAFVRRVTAVRRALEEWIADPHDLAASALSRVAAHPEIITDPTADLVADLVTEFGESMEMLVEAYLLDIEAIAGRAELLQDYIEASDAELMHRLDTSRNKLLRANVLIMTVTTGAAAGSVLTSTFGMNLTSGLEDYPATWWVVGGLALFGVVLFVILVSRYILTKVSVV